MTNIKKYKSKNNYKSKKCKTLKKLKKTKYSKHKKIGGDPSKLKIKSWRRFIPFYKKSKNNVTNVTVNNNRSIKINPIYKINSKWDKLLIIKTINSNLLEIYGQNTNTKNKRIVNLLKDDFFGNMHTYCNDSTKDINNRISYIKIKIFHIILEIELNDLNLNFIFKKNNNDNILELLKMLLTICIYIYTYIFDTYIFTYIINDSKIIDNYEDKEKSIILFNNDVKNYKSFLSIKNTKELIYKINLQIKKIENQDFIHKINLQIETNETNETNITQNTKFLNTKKKRELNIKTHIKNYVQILIKTHIKQLNTLKSIITEVNSDYYKTLFNNNNSIL